MEEFYCSLIFAPGTFDTFISDCLQLLNPYPIGDAIYILSCLCPEDFDVILDLVRLDLNQPHLHPPLSEREVSNTPCSCEKLLQDFQVRTSTIPAQDYCHFWSELTRRWLLSCPIDTSYYRVDDTGKELFCQKLRNELLDRILNIS